MSACGIRTEREIRKYHNMCYCAELKSYMKVASVVLGPLSLTVLMVSVDVKQH